MSPPKLRSRNDWRARRRALSITRLPRPSSRLPCLAAGFSSTAPPCRPALHRPMPRAGRSRSTPILPSSKVCGPPSGALSRRNWSSARWKSKTHACHGLQVKPWQGSKATGRARSHADHGTGDLARRAGDPARVLARPDRSGGGISFDIRPPPGRHPDRSNAARTTVGYAPRRSRHL